MNDDIVHDAAVEDHDGGVLARPGERWSVLAQVRFQTGSDRAQLE